MLIAYGIGSGQGETSPVKDIEIIYNNLTPIAVQYARAGKNTTIRIEEAKKPIQGLWERVQGLSLGPKVLQGLEALAKKTGDNPRLNNSGTDKTLYRIEEGRVIMFWP